MIFPPVVFYSLLFTISAVFCGLILFFYCRRHFSSFAGTFFKHYIIGFFILVFAHSISVLINLQVELEYPFYMASFLVSLYAGIIANLLFFRGALLLTFQDKFRTTIVPLIIMPIFPAVITILSLIFGASSFMIMTLVIWGFLMPVKLFLCFLFFYFFVKGSHFDTVKGKFYTFLMSLVFFISFILDLYLWFSSVPYREYWALKYAGMNVWFMLKTASFWLLLAALLFYSRHLNRLAKPKE